jgi:CheY-like chemotaxis protein
MHLQGARVLIVEDDFMVAMAACDMVESLGGIVAGTARSVAAAKEKIRQPGLDCVMLDVNLNGDLSLGIAAELQERAIPFVFCTAYSHAFDGFKRVPRVMKPYCEHDLVAAFHAVPPDPSIPESACVR